MKRFVLHWLLPAVGVCVIILTVCNMLVVNNAEGRLYSKVNDIPDGYEVGLLLGTSPRTRIYHWRNVFFDCRVKAAAELYHAGKIKRILISGDDNSLDGMDETLCMRDSLLARGVPNDALVLDGKGYCTAESVVRARQVYGLDIFIVISQRFHNERALYLADYLIGCDNAIGYNAYSPQSLMSQKTYIREWFARVKMFVDLFILK